MAEVKKENKHGILEGVFAYAKVAEPSKKYQSEDLEYSVDVIVPKTVAKQWNKDFPKQKAKVFELAEFEEKYKMEAPYEGEDEVFVLKLKKGAMKDGEMFDEKFRPRVLLDIKTDDGVKRVDITTSRLISNGSKGKVSYYVNENSFGKFAQLQNILMNEKDFKEYISSHNGAVGSEFGDDIPVAEAEPENENATKARAKKENSKKPTEKAVDEASDDSPF